jgi:hypothetical protein
MLPILALKPTVTDLEEASMWLAGDPDVFEPRPLKGVAGQIVDSHRERGRGARCSLIAAAEFMLRARISPRQPNSRGSPNDA